MPSTISGPSSPSSTRTSSCDAEDGSMQAVLRHALQHLILEVPHLSQSSLESSFFRRGHPPSVSSVLVSKDYCPFIFYCDIKMYELNGIYSFF